jgi:transcriptional regulator with XRE-family HTH domain
LKYFLLKVIVTSTDKTVKRQFFCLIEANIRGTMLSMEKFVVWVIEELDKRNWRPADLAHKAGVSTGSLSNVLSGKRKAGPDICRAIAQAFGAPPEQVFRLAGLLPELPAQEDELLGQVTETYKRLSPEKRREVLEYALWQLQRQQREREQRHGTSGDAAAAKGPA